MPKKRLGSEQHRKTREPGHTTSERALKQEWEKLRHHHFAMFLAAHFWKTDGTADAFDSERGARLIVPSRLSHDPRSGLVGVFAQMHFL